MKKTIMLLAAVLLTAGLCRAYWDCEWEEGAKKDLYTKEILDSALATETSNVKLVVLSMLRLYQYTLSGNTGGKRLFHPGCSRYGFFAVKKYGSIKGTLMSADRLLRCNPYASGYAIDEDYGLYIDTPENGSVFNFLFDGLNF